MRPISNDMQNRIVQLLKEGVSGEEISTKTGVSTGTISKIRKNHDLGDLKTNGGRPFVISTLLGRRILRNFNSGNYKNASDAARKLLEDDENISAKTISRFLKESGYATIHKPKVLPLTKHLIFSDETKVNRIGSDGLQWAWTNGDKLKDFQVQHMIKHGGGSLILWGCLMWVLWGTVQEHHDNFNVSSFAKHTKAKSFNPFKKELNAALSAIADQDIKKKNRENKGIISWARSKRKNQNELTGTVQIKKYFYKIVRENYIHTKKYLKLIKNLRDTEEEINQIEDGESSAQAEDDDEDDEDTRDLIKSFRNLDHSNKCILSTGKCADNELFLFAIQCQEDHPSKQFIMDVADLNYVQYDVFTEEELDEISTFEEKELPMPPDTILQPMNHFNLTSANQLRTALNNNHTFYNHPDKDIDWINHTIYSLVRKYESGNTKRTHSETWYQTHIWQMIETCFDKLDELEAAIGEPISMANQNRMNNK
ncbi:hypothetical protein G6F17_011631 [Rhizopus arrhizus]|nr:hypothetical protein G6F17_011631 [Rhizopus arrhizus]KAG0906204.1 hypothetical protein G6F33_011565 [Rhizopus arrhizus]